MTTKIKAGVIGDNVVGITQLNVSDGTNGQVLITDGAGTLSFSTISGYTDSDVETYLNTSEIYTDATNNRLGIGTTSPEKILHIKTAVNNTAFARIESTATNSYPTLSLKNDAREYQLTTHGGVSDSFVIYDGTAGANRLVIDSSGNVGIGVTSVSGAKLDVQGGVLISGALTANQTDAGYLEYGSNILTIGSYGNTTGSGIVRFATGGGGDAGGQERMRIDSSGRVGMPAIGQVNVLGTQIPYLSVNGINAQNAHVNIHRHRANGLGGYLSLSKSRSDTKDFTIVQANDELGTISFQGADGSQFQQAAQIQAEVDGTPGSSDMPGRIVFLTTPDGSGTPTEKLRILSGGGITFNGDTAAANALDDYEEGTWTPAFYTYSGVTTTSITNNLATYTKIGNIVHIHANIDVTLSSLPGQTVTITGLPFAASNAGASGQRAIIAVGGDTANTGGNTPKAHFRTNGSQLEGLYYNASNNTAYWTYATMDSPTFALHIHGFYTV